MGAKIDMCCNKIGTCAQNIRTIIGFVLNTTRRAFYNHLERKKLINTNLKSKMTLLCYAIVNWTK